MTVPGENVNRGFARNVSYLPRRIVVVVGYWDVRTILISGVRYRTRTPAIPLKFPLFNTAQRCTGQVGGQIDRLLPKAVTRRNRFVAPVEPSADHYVCPRIRRPDAPPRGVSSASCCLVGHQQSILLPGLPHRDEDRPVVLEHNRSSICVFYQVFEENDTKILEYTGVLRGNGGSLGGILTEIDRHWRTFRKYQGRRRTDGEALSYISYVRKKTGV